MEQISSFTPEQAWQAALGQLKQEMSHAMFITWVQPARLLAFEDGVFKIGCANPYGRDWLESRLSATLGHMLPALLGQEVSVQFVVSEMTCGDGDAEAEAYEDEFEEVESDEEDDLQLDLSVVDASLRNLLIEPTRVVRIPTYFLRWLPYVGARTVFLTAALWQVHYLNSGGKSAGGNAKVSARAEQICQWAGISRAQFFRCLQPGGALEWFAAKRETDYEVDRRSGRTRKSANKYLLYHLPLTPGDAEDLKAYLLSNGIREFPRQALEAALEVDPRRSCATRRASRRRRSLPACRRATCLCRVW